MAQTFQLKTRVPMELPGVSVESGQVILEGTLPPGITADVVVQCIRRGKCGLELKAPAKTSKKSSSKGDGGK